MKINLVTLGCSKNLVDSEKLLGQLQANGYKIIHNSDEYADCVIVNTCGFIFDAKAESVESILHYADAKNNGFIDKLIVMGCLSERYRSSLQEEIPEIDGIFGTNEQDKIVDALGGKYYYAGQIKKRVLTTPSHYAYLKISEGCNRQCAFCAIPSIRGKQISVKIDELVKEAEYLASKGVKELILVAQELTSYGVDIYGKKSLPGLLEELVKVDGIEWIRMHYAYPSSFPTSEIIDLMKKYPKICHYLDVPVQHIDNKILKSMKRGHDADEIYDMISLFRKAIPEITIRTTIITGFPGEGEDEYNRLKDFVKEMRFDRLGIFSYSHEENTPAWKSLPDNIPNKIKKKRLEELMKIQETISLEKNLGKIGRVFKVIIDRREGEFYIGRTEYDSPDVDNEVLIPADDYQLDTGEFYNVKVFDAVEFDLYAIPEG